MSIIFVCNAIKFVNFFLRRTKWFFNRNINTIIELPENMSSDEPQVANGVYNTKILSGTSVGSFFGFRSQGVYKNLEDTYAKDAEGNVMYDMQGQPIIMYNGNFRCYPGDAKYEDINNDGRIDKNDIVYIGNYNPVVSGGGGFNLKYKGVGLTVFLHYRLGQKVINQARMNAEGLSYDFPVADNATAEGRQQNRRVEIYISANQAMVDAAAAQAN